MKELESHGHEVVCIDIRSDLRTDITEFDILMDDWPDGVDCVVHLAAKPGVGWSVENPAECHVQNVIGTENVLRAARLHRVRRFVFASSSTVYGRNPKTPWGEYQACTPASPYGETKVEGERLCDYYARYCGMSCVVLRLFSVYGPRMREDLAMRRLADSLLPEGSVFRMRGDGSSARDYTYVGDVARAFRLAVESDVQGTFNICGGSPRTLDDVVKVLGSELGQEPNVERLYSVEAWEPARTWGDNSRALAELGWKPETDFQQGVRLFANWWRASTGWKPPMPED